MSDENILERAAEAAGSRQVQHLRKDSCSCQCTLWGGGGGEEVSWGVCVSRGG